MTIDETESEPTPEPNLELAYCIEQEFPEAVTATLMELVSVPRWKYTDRRRALSAAFLAWNEWGNRDNDDFIETIVAVISEDCSLCDDCGDIYFDDDTTLVENGNRRVCDPNCLRNYYLCEGCEEYYSETTRIRGNEYCEGCLRNYYLCEGCEEYYSETTRIRGNEYCEGCVDNFSYCDHCEEYYDADYDDSHDHNDSCDCEAPKPYFRFPNGKSSVDQNENLTVSLPSGTIDQKGLTDIYRLIYTEIKTDKYVDVTTVLGEIGPEWQTKRGNFTRRLSSALHKAGGKLTPDAMTKVGNIARQHSSSEAKWNIAFTRDLNMSADDFGNSDSCWWQSYYLSRCCLKNWGGLGIRSFEDDGDGYVSGRAWILPLAKDLKPTHNTQAHAYMIFNGYGDLSGYAPARIVAQLTGRTYRKVHFNASEMYVNSNAGYLVADEETCASVEGETYFSFDTHNTHDADTIACERITV